MSRRPLTLIMFTQRLHNMIQNSQVSELLTLGLRFAERPVLETIIKYIIIMMLHFVLYILIYSILSSI